MAFSSTGPTKTKTVNGTGDVVTLTVAGGTGSSSPYHVDLRQNTNIAFGCDVSAGATLTYSVEHTFDEDPDDSNAIWFAHESFSTPASADADGNYAFPPTGIRLTMDTWTAGTVEMKLIASGKLN